MSEDKLSLPDKNASQSVRLVWAWNLSPRLKDRISKIKGLLPVNGGKACCINDHVTWLNNVTRSILFGTGHSHCFIRCQQWPLHFHLCPRSRREKLYGIAAAGNLLFR